MTGVAGDVTYYASSVGKNCTNGRKIAISWTSDVALDWVAQITANPKSSTFPATDAVVFEWTGTHNVQLMADEASWTACDFTGALDLGSVSGVTATGAAGDTAYYASSVGKNCTNGRKIAITWAAADDDAAAATDDAAAATDDAASAADDAAAATDDAASATDDAAAAASTPTPPPTTAAPTMTPAPTITPAPSLPPTPLPTPSPTTLAEKAAAADEDDDDDDGVDAASAFGGMSYWWVVIVLLVVLNVFLCCLLYFRVCIPVGEDELTEHMEIEEKVSFASCNMDGSMKLEQVYAGKALP